MLQNKGKLINKSCLCQGNSEQEWKEVLGYRSKSKHDQGTTIAVNILVLGKTKLSNCRQDLKVSIIVTMVFFFYLVFLL